MKSYEKLLLDNKNWATNKTTNDPDYFLRLVSVQKPDFLWIGCSDSRIPANEITGTKSGEIFVHRNIANMVIHTDMSMLSVLDWSINILKVSHIIVCGHYGCGGITAALGNKQVGLIDNWLRHIKDVYRLHKAELDAIEDSEAQHRRMVELNVEEQVLDLAKTSIVQNAWARGQFLQVHGLVYDINNGLLKDLNVTVDDTQEIDTVYKFELA